MGQRTVKDEAGFTNSPEHFISHRAQFKDRCVAGGEGCVHRRSTKHGYLSRFSLKIQLISVNQQQLIAAGGVLQTEINSINLICSS